MSPIRPIKDILSLPQNRSYSRLDCISHQAVGKCRNRVNFILYMGVKWRHNTSVLAASALIPGSCPGLTMSVEWLPGGDLALAGCRVAGGGGRGLAAASPTVRVDPTSVPHLLLLLVFLLLQVLLLLGAPEVGHVAGQGR